jgi:protein kinase X
MAPEIVEDKGHSYPVDWWALGALIYEMIDGFPPFYHEHEMKVYKRIISNDYKEMNNSFSPELKDLIKKFLVKDPTQRLGFKSTTTGITDIQQHPWFAKVHWKALMKGNVEPPYIPRLKSSVDTSHFDEYLDDTKHQDKVSSMYIFEIYIQVYLSISNEIYLCI